MRLVSFARGPSVVRRRKAVLSATRLLLVLVAQTSSAVIRTTASCLQEPLSAPQASLTCRDGDGRAVDWWLILKAPNGTRFGYVDAVTAAREAHTGNAYRDEDAPSEHGGASSPDWHPAEGHSASSDGGWRAAAHLNCIRSPLSRTLLPLYSAADLSGCACSVSAHSLLISDLVGTVCGASTDA